MKKVSLLVRGMSLLSFTAKIHSTGKPAWAYNTNGELGNNSITNLTTAE